MADSNPAHNPYQTVRDGKGRYRRGPQAAAQDARAAELFGQGLSYNEIAAELRITKSSAIKAVQRCMRDIVKGPAEAALAAHVDRLEYIFTRCMEIAETDHVVVSHGKVITMPDPETGEEKPLKDSAPTLAAFREARAALADFRKMTGLDQPTKVEHSGGVKYELVGVDPEDLK